MRVVPLLALLFVSCAPPPEATVGKTKLPRAHGIEKWDKNPEAKIVEFPGDDLSTLPKEEHIHLAIARDVKWHEARDLFLRLDAAKKKTLLLAGKRSKVGVFTLNENLNGPAIRLWTNTEGKACVSPPGVEEAACMKHRGSKHINRISVRQLIRQAVNEYGLRNIVVEVPPDLEWADVVRAVDGSRTCCKKGEPPRVRVREIPPE